MKKDNLSQQEMIEESHGDYMERIKKGSDIALLFGPPSMSDDKNLVGGIVSKINDARPLLDSAILTANVGSETCPHCGNVEQLLEAFRVAIRLVLEAGERENAERAGKRKGKAA